MATDNRTDSKTKTPNVRKRVNAKDGSTSFVAWVRVKGFKATAKTFSTLVEAREWQTSLTDELRAQAKRSAVRPDLPTLTVKALADEYLADPATKALRSYDSLEPLVLWWVGHYATAKVRDFGVLAVREGRETLRASGLSPARCNRYLSAMRSAWNWGRAAGLVAPELVWPSRVMLPEPKGRTRHLNDAELTALLNSAAKTPLMHAAILVSLATGVRLSELLRLTWADVDLDRSSVRVLLAKNGESRVVFLPGVAADALRVLKRADVVSVKHVFVKPDGEPLDKHSLEYRWKLVRTEAGLADFRWHDLRHSCASFLAQRGASLLEIGSVLGHKSPSVTQRYAHLVAGKAVTGHDALDSKLRGASKPTP
jgi:integrase